MSVSLSSQYSIEPSQSLVSASQASSASQATTASQTDTTTVFLPDIPTINSTERCCFICKRTDRRKVVPDSAVRQCWRVRNVFLNKTTRCCPFHLVGDLFTIDSLQMITSNKTGIYMDSSDVCRWILELTNQTKNKPRVDFSDPEDISTEDFATLVPCSRASFQDMFSIIRPRMRSSSNRHAANALGMFWMVLRLNLTQTFIAFLFRTEQRVVSQAIQSVSDLLHELYVPRHLGYAHLSREAAIEQHSHVLFNQLFNKHESLFLIVDGRLLYYFILNRIE
jgi:hypothetical protein